MSDDTTSEQRKEPGMIGKSFKKGTSRFKTFWIECKRVLKVTKKPSQSEFKTIVSICAIGLVIIGTIGFLIHVIKETLF